LTQQLTTKAILERALAIIEDPERWTQGAYARHANGNPIGPLEENACRWCALGALEKAGDDPVSLDALYALNNVSGQMGGLTPHDLNDQRSHADVVEMFKRAIAACEQERGA